MQDADDVDDARIGGAVVQGVRSGGELAVAGADVIAGATEVLARRLAFGSVNGGSGGRKKQRSSGSRGVADRTTTDNGLEAERGCSGPLPVTRLGGLPS